MHHLYSEFEHTCGADSRFCSWNACGKRWQKWHIRNFAYRRPKRIVFLCCLFFSFPFSQPICCFGRKLFIVLCIENSSSSYAVRQCCLSKRLPDYPILSNFSEITKEMDWVNEHFPVFICYTRSTAPTEKSRLKIKFTIFSSLLYCYSYSAICKSHFRFINIYNIMHWKIQTETIDTNSDEW